MEDGKPDENNTEGKNHDKSVKDDEETISELNKLKTHNDEVEKELVRGRTLKAESQELEAEKMLGGESDAGQTLKESKKDTDEEYADKFMKGEANPLGEDGISLD